MFRAHKPITTITISNTLADCDPVPKKAFTSGSLGIIPASTITQLDVYTSHDEGATWGQAFDESGPMTITVTAHATEPVFPCFPDGCFKHAMLKFRAQTGATEEEATVFVNS